MAHNTMTIPVSTDKARPSAKGAARSTPSQTRAKANFAQLMANEQKDQTPAQTKTEQAQPKVARLPDVQGLPLRGAGLAGRTPSDMLRMQNFNKAGNDIARSRAMDSFLQSAGSGTLDIARGMNAANNLRVVASAANGKGFALNSGDYIRTRNLSRISSTASRQKSVQEKGLGKLSAQFESGKDGIAAIGYDSTGGTSYGKYQIASKVGSMKSFLSFLDQEAPDISKRLRQSGPANTGSRRGGMPDAWRAIAKQHPERFEQLQEAFIHQSHYKPALEAIEQRTGIDASSLSAAMREVIWSTAVQHGPAGAARIFARADDLSGKHDDAGYERKMINNVYNVRAGQFGSSTSQVRDAVRNRFRQERQLALKMLDGAKPGSETLA